MAKKLRRRGTAALAASFVVAGPVIAACSSGPSYDEWAATDGAAGRINLDDVQEAFKDSDSVTEFERRVNEVYEGDNIVLIRAEQDGSRLILEGWEDLNNSNSIDDTQDDRLFSIVNENERNEMRGYGANGYYNSGFGGGNFLFGFLLGSVLFGGGPRIYTTPATRVGTIRSDRASYRSSSQYRSQVSRNTSYFNNQRRFAGSRFDNSTVSRNRQTYLNNQRQSGAFRNSTTGVRSSFGSRGSTRSSFGGGRSSGGFRGFGGTQAVIGIIRRG